MLAIRVRFVGLRNGGEFKCFTMMLAGGQCPRWATKLHLLLRNLGSERGVSFNHCTEMWTFLIVLIT